MDNRPTDCRFRLQDESKAYPRSSCTACGKSVTTGLGSHCTHAARAAEREGDLHMAQVATNEWFAAHDAYHKASDAYNQRLAVVKAERERGNWSMTTDPEYQTLSSAQSKAMATDNDLYFALRAARRHQVGP